VHTTADIDTDLVVRRIADVPELVPGISVPLSKLSDGCGTLAAMDTSHLAGHAPRAAAA